MNNLTSKLNTLAVPVLKTQQLYSNGSSTVEYVLRPAINNSKEAIIHIAVTPQFTFTVGGTTDIANFDGFLVRITDGIAVSGSYSTVYFNPPFVPTYYYGFYWDVRDYNLDVYCNPYTCPPGEMCPTHEIHNRAILIKPYLVTQSTSSPEPTPMAYKSVSNNSPILEEELPDYLQ